MKKKLLILISVMMLILVACGDDDKSSTPNKEQNTQVPATEVADVDFSKLKDNMIAADADIPAMSLASSEDENAADLFKYLADFDYTKVDKYFFSYATAGTAEEVAVVRLKSKADADALNTALNKHISTRVKQFETYDPTQVSMAKAGIVVKNENYCILIICKDKDAVKKAFYDTINN